MPGWGAGGQGHGDIGGRCGLYRDSALRRQVAELQVGENSGRHGHRRRVDRVVAGEAPGRGIASDGDVLTRFVTEARGAANQAVLGIDVRLDADIVVTPLPSGSKVSGTNAASTSRHSATEAS